MYNTIEHFETGSKSPSIFKGLHIRETTGMAAIALLVVRSQNEKQELS